MLSSRSLASLLYVNLLFLSGYFEATDELTSASLSIVYSPFEQPVPSGHDPGLCGARNPRSGRVPVFGGDTGLYLG